MNTLLLILGVLGIGAIVIAAYVFTVAARNYVSESSASPDVSEDGEKKLYVVRSNQDRRQFTGNVEFPLNLPSGEVIQFDRRRLADRRLASG